MFKIVIFPLIKLLSLAITADACCDTIVPIMNFNSSRFAGAWYVHQVDRKQEVRNCYRGTYKLIDNNQYSLTQNYRTPNGTWMSNVQTLKLDDNGLGFWSSTDPDQPRLTIISTDYDNYAVGALCLNRFGSNVWILLRNYQIITPLTNANILAAIDYINFHPNYLMNTTFDGSACRGIATKPHQLLISLLPLFLALFTLKN